MKFIDRIEIKYFRSFSDNPTKIYNLKDINIFSGGNDSGKSNVLRALNLFFNEKIDHGTPFNFERDFSIFQQEKIKEKYNKKKSINEEEKQKIRKTSAFIEIKIYFSLDMDEKGSLPQNFWISKRRTTTKNAEVSSNTETEYTHEHVQEKIKLGKTSQTRINKLNSLKKTQTLFLKKIDFFYVPAIKDIFFFGDLYNALQEKLAEDTNKKLEGAVGELQKEIQTQTKELFEKFKHSTGLDASFLLEGKILDFKRNVEVITDERSEKVLLKSRGDGIQARLIPDILAELSSKSKRKYIIRGFEEPENSYEYKNSIKLAEEFYDKYSNEVQLFITTHAKEFLAIQDPIGLKEEEKKVSIYRIIKAELGNSDILYYDEKKGYFIDKEKKQFCTMDGLYEDLGIIDQSRLISEMEKKIYNLSLNKEEFEILKNDLDNTIGDLMTVKEQNIVLNEKIEQYRNLNKIHIYCEGKNEDFLNNLGITEVIFIGGQDKIGVFESTKNKGNNLPFGIIDKDYLLASENQLITENTNTIILDYYCIENYLYHPDNLEEFKISKGTTFNKVRYTTKIINEKISWRNNKINKYTISGIREKYYGPIMKYIKETAMITLPNTPDPIEQDLQSTEFDVVYAHIPMKDRKGKFTELKGIQDIELSGTNRFKQKVIDKISFLFSTPAE